MIDEFLAIDIFTKIHKNESKYAYAYGLNLDESNNILLNFIELKKSLDIYQLIEDIKEDSSALIWDAIALTTQGWAAPLDSDKESETPPSEHPERKRVLLMSIITSDNKICSVIQMEDSLPLYDQSATGALADSLLTIYPKDKIFYENNN